MPTRWVGWLPGETTTPCWPRSARTRSVPEGFTLIGVVAEGDPEVVMEGYRHMGPVGYDHFRE